MTLFIVAMLMLPLFLGQVVRQQPGVRFFATVFRSGVFAEAGFPVLTYLLIWPAYGFAAGHLFALLFRKSLVAGAAGLMVGATLAGLWLPSLLGGGLHVWQPLVPLLLMLLTARLLAWPWATETVGARRPLVRLAVGLTAVLVAAAGGIAWRVGEVPLVAEIEDDVKYARQIPTYDEKQPGRDSYRRTASLFEENGVKVLSAGPDEPLLPTPEWNHQPFDQQPKTYVARMRRVLEVGWPADRPDLDAWTDRLFATAWDEPIFAAAKKPDRRARGPQRPDLLHAVQEPRRTPMGPVSSPGGSRSRPTATRRHSSTSSTPG